jgi:hypothetical protein
MKNKDYKKMAENKGNNTNQEEAQEEKHQHIIEEEPLLGIDNLKGFIETLQQSTPTGQDILIRKGTTEDIFLENKDSSKGQQQLYGDVDASTCGTGYTEKEFDKEFNNHEFDPDALFDQDYSRLNLTEFTITERTEKSVEDLADTLSSTETFNGNKKNYLVLRVKLPKEDPKTIDVDVQEDSKVFIFSHKYKLRTFLPKPVLTQSIKTSFTMETEMLEVVMRHK